MKKTVTLTSRELIAIEQYAQFMLNNPEPCNKKCGPPGSPDRRACCGCPDHGDWEKLVKNFKMQNMLSSDILNEETVKVYIAANTELLNAALAVAAANEREKIAQRAFKKAYDAITVEYEE